MSVMSWIRARVGTYELPTFAQRGIAGMNREPGPFDHPPAEPVELDEADLPWELRESDDDRA